MTVECGCRETCGDLPEEQDDPNAVCKRLPVTPVRLDEIFMKPRDRPEPYPDDGRTRSDYEAFGG